jgi:hypothetical protein
MNIESRYANNDLQKELKEIKLKINPILEDRYVAMKFGVNTEGGDYMLTSRQLLDALVNCNLFHTNIERETETSIIQSSEPLGSTSEYSCLRLSVPFSARVLGLFKLFGTTIILTKSI